ncbi:MAG: glycosyltransferase family 2 protein [Flavobacteriales bacterium]|nr:glycosyltransferase family 2 protein [Flavobacteriales bacterium]
MDILCLGQKSQFFHSQVSNLYFGNIKKINEEVRYQLQNSRERYILFTFKETSIEQPKRVEKGGYIIGNNKVCFPELVSFSMPLSYFNMAADENRFAHTCWLLDFDGLCVDKALLRNGFLDPRFQSVQGALMFWIYNQLNHGAIVRYEPKGAASPKKEENVKVPFVDQLRFVRYVMGRKWMCWTIIRLSFRKLILALKLIPQAFALWSEVPLPNQSINWKSWRFYEQALGSVTVIIPTVDRYSYLVKLLNQLRVQTIKPFEVLVIDQTDQKDRQDITIADLPLKTFTLDEAGQCRSRNLGLKHAQGDFILFLDDDDEIYPQLIEDHLRTLAYFNADVSCGVCREPGQRDNPKSFYNIRLSDVFSTNNSMVRKAAIQKAGFFDIIYDRGQKADGDLGARLHRSGALMILNPEITVLHHRAPRGGLRKHNVRRITYESSRKYVTHFRLPHITELYFNMKYLTTDQQREYLWHILLGTFSIRGNLSKKFAKVIWALINLPFNYSEIRKRLKKAKEMYKATKAEIS